MTPFRTPSPARARGMTLVELMVAMAIGLLVILVAVAALSAGQQGFRTVDNTTGIRDQQRFAVDLMSKVVRQAGFENVGTQVPATRRMELKAGRGDAYEPDIYGWNNAVYAQPSDMVLSEITNITNGNRVSKCGSNTDTSCVNGSDILVVRFQGASAGLAADGTPNSSPDNSMIDCAGNGVSASLPDTGGRPDLLYRPASVLYVQRNTTSGEPSLMCASYRLTAANTWGWSVTPLIQGVESLQVLYGTSGVTPGTAVPASTEAETTTQSSTTGAYTRPTDQITLDRWLRADQLTVAGDPVGTRRNWRQVRAVKIGLVMRGDKGSAQEDGPVLYPLGAQYVPATATDDPFTQFTPPSDGRLRQTTSFTVYLPNWLSLNN